MWREPQYHHDDGCFCMIHIFGFSYKTKYPNLPTAVRPVPHSNDLLLSESMPFVDDIDDENEKMCYDNLDDDRRLCPSFFLHREN